MRRKKKTPPPWYEWDFGKVPENERDWCALWECAREAKWVTKEVKNWFSTRFAFHVPFAVERSYKLDENTKGAFGPPGAAGKTVLEVLRKAGRTRNDGLDCLAALPVTLQWGTAKPPATLLDTFPRFLREFCQLVVELPRFPTPWLKINPDQRKRALARMESSGCSIFRDKVPAIRIEEFNSGVERIQLAEAIMRGTWPESAVREDHRHYVLTVDWDEFNYDKVVEQFKAWLKKNPHRRKRRGGRKSGSPIAHEALRNLATLQWKKAGFEFAEAKAVLVAQGKGDCDLLNVHNRKSGKNAGATYDVWRHRWEAAEKAQAVLFPLPTL